VKGCETRNKDILLDLQPLRVYICMYLNLMWTVLHNKEQECV